jgi:hydrogenase small subunit
MEFQEFLPEINRRDFIKTVVTVSAMLGLPYGMSEALAATAENPDKRPPVIWLHFQECTGCSESLLRSSHPEVATLILDMISLDYHETLMAGAGHQAEAALHDSMHANYGKYILVVEGAIPTRHDGIYCKVAGKTAIDSLKEVAAGAAAIISMGTCASYGGIQSVGPNPTGAVGVGEIIKDKAIINIPGCPPNPYNFLSTVLYYATFDKLPELDAMGRPKFAYGRLIHQHCERRPHFDAGRFASAYGDDDHSQGHCLYKLGCKGPVTHANCSVVRFNDVGAWPVSIGHPCIGCTEPDILFKSAISDKVQIHEPTPFNSYAPVESANRSKGIDPLTTGIVGLAAGAVVGAGAMLGKKLPDAAQKEEGHEKSE